MSQLPEPPRFFVGVEKVGEADFETRQGDDAKVTIEQLWNRVYHNSAICGEKLKISFERKWGLSKSEYKKTTNEIGAVLNLPIASISASISSEIQSQSTISQEHTTTEQKELVAPECGRNTLQIFQLVSRYILEYSFWRGRFNKTKINEKKIYDVPQSSFFPTVRIEDEISECGIDCKKKKDISYNRLIQLDFKKSSTLLPGKITKKGIFLFGQKDTKPISGKKVNVEKLSGRMIKNLKVKPYEKGNLTVLTKPKHTTIKPEIKGLPTYGKFMNKSFQYWYKGLPQGLKTKIGKQVYSQDQFNKINWSLITTKAYGYADLPSKTTVANWVREVI